MYTLLVTPFAGVWIEICSFTDSFRHDIVTPFAGVWIEIKCDITPILTSCRHSLRGSVD